jgi:CRP/FNR family cyclic AMP-dependent transcriptional regulator
MVTPSPMRQGLVSSARSGAGGGGGTRGGGEQRSEGAEQSVARSFSVGEVGLFDEDAGLRGVLRDLSPAEAESARRIHAPAWELSRGRWDPTRTPPFESLEDDLLLLDGLLLARLGIDHRHSAEVLGAGDPFRVQDPDTRGYATVASEREFRVLLPARLVALDRNLVSELAAVPGATCELQRRWAERVRSLAVRLAIAQVPNLSERVYLVLWHLADRWGRRCADGAVIPFRVTQQVLAESACAQRSSVAAALRELRERGSVEQNGDGHWVLHTPPPGDFT